MSETQYYVVENADAVEQTESDLGANEHRVSLPVVAGPFDSPVKVEEEFGVLLSNCTMVALPEQES